MEIDKITDQYEIIDLRDNSSFNLFHLPNSKNISLYNLLVNHEKYLSKEKKYLLVCEYGIKSKKTSEILNNIGYKTFSLKNGIQKLIDKNKC